MVCRKGEGGKREVGLGVVLPSLFPEQGYDQSTLKRDFFFFFPFFYNPVLFRFCFFRDACINLCYSVICPSGKGRLELFCVLMYTYTHNPALTLLLLRTSKELEFFLLFFFSLQWVLSVNKNCAIPVIFFRWIFTPHLLTARVSMAQTFLSFVKFGSAGK